MNALRFAAIFALLSAPVLADEVWDSDMGQIVYEAEEGGAAIFSFTNVDAYPAKLIIPGLAGNYSNRSSHDAYWIGQGAGACTAFMSHGNTPASSQWGRAQVVFDGPAFPTSLTVVLGFCLDEPNIVIRGE
ncbi:hypothetical protein FEE96_18090 [Parasedimentitalea maritima]|uniref:Uncharacterized protein n=1 Tax=Parasedimentitalea maritima TaxID=2578117 RepID=A0ABY2UR00_9RHOB|nr:hypothetical protein [Zongyanglinia marina]TLP58343.1 hypothetical protein FEE96_18090 [Zongyanglinia marina]